MPDPASAIHDVHGQAHRAEATASGLGQAATSHIELRGVRVHNLQSIDLDLPLGRLIAVTGVSGAGKSSLAFDTLCAESQRRYIESFPTSARPFLERLEQPLAESIGPLPPAIAVRQGADRGSRTATLATLTELADGLRLLYARAGTVFCPRCRTPVERHTPASLASLVAAMPAGKRLQVGFPLWGSDAPADWSWRRHHVEALARGGYRRVLANGTTVSIDDATIPTLANDSRALVIVDRLSTPLASLERLTDSLEAAFSDGEGECALVVNNPDPSARDESLATILRFSSRFECGQCDWRGTAPEPALFNPHSSQGACPACRGTGLERPAHPVAGCAQAPLDPELTRCSSCLGGRLNPQALAVRVGDRNFAAFLGQTVAEAGAFLLRLRHSLPPAATSIEPVLTSIERRLEMLAALGLGYLALDRPQRSLSRGEAQRARVAAACASQLVNMLYVLDEPTAGLHPQEARQMVDVLRGLQKAGNTLVAVEHNRIVIEAADHVVDLGPRAGNAGGRVVFSGPPSDLLSHSESLTAEHLRPQAAATRAAARQRVPSGWLQLTGVNFRNLRDVTIDFPLGVVCAVSGVSGSGKSSLVVETLVPAVRGAIAGVTPATSGGAQPSLTGAEGIDAVACLDARPVARSARSLPAGYLGILGEIRAQFASTAEARARNYSPRHFSLNAADGGRCATCAGMGGVTVDMQFLPDLVVPCPDCEGTRFRREILDVKYRGLSFAQVLDLTAGEAFPFFRGQTRIQRRLKFMKDAGLEYVRLGQPARTLSGGESQRLKLAGFLAQRTRARTLLVLEEPSIGLHPFDVERLLECWESLLAAGHSLIVIEHDPTILARADHVIDLGPGAGPEGGRVVVAGPPGAVAACPASVTGRFLRVS